MQKHYLESASSTSGTSCTSSSGLRGLSLFFFVTLLLLGLDLGRGGVVLVGLGHDSLIGDSELLSDVGEAGIGEGVVVVSPVVDVGEVLVGGHRLEHFEASQVGDLELWVRTGVILLL